MVQIHLHIISLCTVNYCKFQVGALHHICTKLAPPQEDPTFPVVCFLVRISQSMLVKVSINENLLIDFCIHVIRE